MGMVRDEGKEYKENERRDKEELSESVGMG